MLRLLRLAFYLVVCGVLLYFAATVKLGSRTFIGHMRAIAGTPEAKELAEGTREQAGNVAKHVKESLRGGAAAPGTRKRTDATAGTEGKGAAGPPPPAESLDEQDREALDRLVREHTTE